MINREQLLDSLDQLDDELLLEADQARQQRSRRKIPRGLTAAACVALVLLATLTVEAQSGAVSSLLAPLFGGTRTEIVDHIGSPIGASVSADGYTITADAIIGDRYNLAVVYTLTRDDGQPLPENLRFQEWETRYKFLGFFGIGSGGGSLSGIKNEEDPSQYQIIEQWSGDVPLLGRMCRTTFGGLVQWNEDGTETLLAEGPWTLSYTASYTDATETIRLPETVVQNEYGVELEIGKLRLSPVGLYMDLEFLTVLDDTPKMLDVPVSIIGADGTETQLSGNCGANYAEGDTTANGHYTAMFPVPQFREEIAGLRICDTVVWLPES